MRLERNVYSIACSDHEYEDAFFSGRVREGLPVAPFRAAVADGASTASFSAMWARQLVLGFASGRLSVETFPQCFNVLGERWARRALRRVGPTPAWYLDAKLRQGSAATLLGLEFRASVDGAEAKWRAVAVGDSCLAHVREECLLATFPLSDPGEFSSHPALIHSRIDVEAPKELLLTEGQVLPGDSFYLMTDALAKWFMQENAKGEHPWMVLSGFPEYSEPTFSSWALEKRASGEMDDDDVTLVSIRVRA